MVSFYIWVCVSFPGYTGTDGTSAEFYNWFDETFNRIALNSMHALWLSINIAACLLTIVAIRSIFATVKQIASSSRQELSAN